MSVNPKELLSPRAYDELMRAKIRRAARANEQAGPLTLPQFIRQAWHVLEPATAYVHGWHIDAISEHLLAVTSGQIRNLVINMPPRHMKSLSVSVLWPMWVWTFKPEMRWLFASYAAELAIRDSLKCRRLIQSPWYQERWSHVFKLAGDQNMKHRFENDAMGYRISTGVGGSATGEGGDVVIVDDAHKTQEAESDKERENVLIWWDETMSTRLNDPKTGAKVIIGQRVHEGDLSGHVLEQGGYEHLVLPAEYEGKKFVTGIGWSDPRTVEGELLWPERFGPPEISDLKRELGIYGTAGQLQQRPAPRGGGKFKREWFEIVESVPLKATRVRYWDKAATEEGQGSTSHTCGVLLARDADNMIIVEDVVRGQWETGDRDRVMLQTAVTDGVKYGKNGVRIWLEQEPGSGGKDSAKFNIKMLIGYPVYADKVTGSKMVRAEPLISYASGGNVKLLKAGWNKGYIERLCLFPGGTYKDEIDATSGAFNKITATGTSADTETMEKLTAPTPSRWGDTSRRGYRKW